MEKRKRAVKKKDEDKDKAMERGSPSPEADEGPIPAFPEDEPHGEKLYRLRMDSYVQHSGRGTLPPALQAFAKMNGGNLPPYMPMPEVPVEFHLGDGYGKNRHLKWLGHGVVPPQIIAFVVEHGTLPPYSREQPPALCMKADAP